MLILACTAAEAMWKGVLRENGVKSKNPTIADYVKLAVPLRLGEYAIRFRYQPWLPDFRPFEKWHPKTSPLLPWYTAYNKVKHDLEKDFHRATLKTAIEAIAGCAVLYTAQMGHGYSQMPESVFPSERPSWQPHQCYVEVDRDTRLKPMNYPFP